MIREAKVVRQVENKKIQSTNIKNENDMVNDIQNRMNKAETVRMLQLNSQQNGEGIMDKVDVLKNYIGNWFGAGGKTLDNNKMKIVRNAFLKDSSLNKFSQRQRFHQT